MFEVIETGQFMKSEPFARSSSALGPSIPRNYFSCQGLGLQIFSKNGVSKSRPIFVELAIICRIIMEYAWWPNLKVYVPSIPWHKVFHLGLRSSSGFKDDPVFFRSVPLSFIYSGSLQKSSNCLISNT